MRPWTAQEPGLRASGSRWSGIGATVNGQVRTRDVRSLRSGHEGHQGSNLINMPIAFKCGDGDLRRCPVARCGIQIGIDRAGLNVVDRDAPSPQIKDNQPSRHDKLDYFIVLIYFIDSWK
jgi:hypothetical protein